MSYLSLIVYETQGYLVNLEPALAEALTLQFSDLIGLSRNRIKLFDDNRLEMDGVASYFSRGLIPAHRAKFVESVRLPLASVWKTDLGLVDWAGKRIATTHSVHFNMGTPPEMLNDQSGVMPTGIGEDLGRYLAGLSGAFRDLMPQLDWEGSSFLKLFDPSVVTVTDVRSAHYYQSLFGRRLPIGTIAALDAFRCSLRTIDVLLSADTSTEAQGTLFKIRFVTLYHVLSGLSQLRSAHASELDGDDIDLLARIEQHPTSVILRSRQAGWLRNTLVHYGLSKQYPTSAIGLWLPLAGMVDFYFVQVGFVDLAAALEEHVDRVAGWLDDWAK
jgi:hypothetical protein